MKKLSVLLLVLVLVLALASCGVIELPANEDFADAALKAAYEVTEFEVSEDFKLANTVTDAAGHTYNVVWTSSDERVLAVTNGEKEATVKVTPSYFGEMVVILTGTITEGEVTAEVKLTYTVPGVTCTHEYEITRTEEPNCGVDGLQAYRCKHCGRQYMETLFATGAHDYQLTEVVAPAATAHGYTLYTCTVCEQTKTEDTTHAFVYEYAYFDPTCTEEGLHIMICYVCATQGDLVYDETDPNAMIVIPATGHDFSVEVEVVAPGCGTNGYTVYGCANCDATENRDEVPATSTHDFSVFVETVAPTCTSDGYTTYKCANCEATENRDTVTGAHDFSVLVATVAPTCTVDGYTTYKCANCEATENRDTVDATGKHVDSDDCICDYDNCEVEVLPTTNDILTVAQALYIANKQAAGQYTSEKYMVTGIISRVDNSTYGNVYIVDEEGGTEFYVYGIYSAKGSVQYNSIPSAPKAGDTVVLLGILGSYKNNNTGAVTLQLKSGWIVHECEYEFACTACKTCGEFKDAVDHVGGTATCQAAAVCTVCSNSYGEKVDHVWGDDGACTTPGCDATKPAAGDPVVKTVTITAKALGLGAYKDGTKTVDDLALQFIELGDYGNGIQMRNKNGKVAELWNTAAVPGKIVKIELTYNAAQANYSNANALKITFGDTARTAEETLYLSTVKNQTTPYTITPNGDWTYFDIKINITYALYWDSIVVYYEVPQA